MSINVLERQSVRLLAIAWGLVLLGALVLIFRYTSLPESVVLYRLPWVDSPTVGSKSFLTVGRIALMGVGQLGAATAMTFATRGSERWERFWRWLGLVAGLKTLLECLSTVTARESDVAFLLTTLAVVAVFVMMAARWWRRGDLREHPRLAGPARIWLIASLCLWAGLALAPVFLA